MRHELVVTVVCYLILFVLGAVAMYSLDLAREMVLGTDSRFLQKQVTLIFVSLLVFTLLLNVPFDFYVRRIWWIYAAGFLSLLAVFAFPSIGGVNRWITFGPFSLQPSEFAKLLLALTLSVYAERNWSRMREFTRGFVLPMVLALLYAAPILLQPNLSTAGLVLILALLTVYFAGTRVLYLLLTLALGSVLFAVSAGMGWLRGYQIGRLTHFLTGTMAPQVEVALRTVRNSGVTGSGLGGGWLKVYVPEAESDFVLAVIGEDFGFFGILIVVVTYLFLAYSLMRLTRYVERPSLRIFAWSYTSLILLHITINLGVFSGVLPVTGVPLPFVSAGGSSMLATLAGFAIVLSGLTNKERVRIVTVVSGGSLGGQGEGGVD